MSAVIGGEGIVMVEMMVGSRLVCSVEGAIDLGLSLWIACIVIGDKGGDSR